MSEGEPGAQGGLAPSTRVVRAGLPEARPGEPFMPGPVMAGPFHVPGDLADANYIYGRDGNPTFELLEEALGSLAGGNAVAFSSGMAAAVAVLETSLPPEGGGILVAPRDGYAGVRELAEGSLRARGVETRLVRSTDADVRAALPGAALAWIETPSNPALDVLDVAALSEAARAEGTVLVVDNTLATPLGQRPLELGADLVVSSASKHLSGHSDVVLGYAAARDPARAGALREQRRIAGAIPGPFEAWLAHRSLATLAVRLERQSASALALAELLVTRPEVSQVRYPGLADDPSHALAAAQMDSFGSVLGFTLPSRAAAERFLGASELITEATSFGGVHTSGERRARWGTDDVAEGFIRLSVGIEDPGDLARDLVRALDRACRG
ncbi:MAG: cystathionine gamma-lyase [Solirubrobacteraceae bacterium]